MSTPLSLVGQWNEVMLDAIRSTGASPTATTYHMHLTSAAMYDAWAAYDDDAYGYYTDLVRPASEHTDENKAVAISYAAHRMLSEFFPTETGKFDAFLQSLGYDLSIALAEPSNPAFLGHLAYQGVLTAREDDGSNRENGYADTSGYVPLNDPQEGSPNAPGGDGFNPNHWQPLRIPNGTLLDDNGNPTYDDTLPGTFSDQVALTPHWGSVTAFATEDVGQIRPATPPRLGDMSEYVDGLGNVTTGDQAYRDQFTEVAQTSATLNTTQKVIAEYWADGPRTESPPGHWNQIAQDISLREGHDNDDDVKMFFALNAALLDAGIATWDAKYHYDAVRPQSAIRHLFYDQEIEAWAGPDQGTQTILGQEWQPYQDTTFVTPPFPEYTSGHSSFSMAAANTIAAFVGSDAFYDGVSLSNYDLDDIEGTDLLGQYVATDLLFETFTGDPVVLQWSTLTEAAEEAGVSRIYGGIHIQDGDLNGREIGSEVAELAHIKWQALFTRAGDDLIDGTAEADTLFAGTGNDTVHAGAGNDRIYGEAGDDTLNGEDGDADVAVMQALETSYTITFSDMGTTVQDRRPDGTGTDRLIDIELLNFKDASGNGQASATTVDLAALEGVTMASAAQLEALTQLYLGLFNRAPDSMGLFYWASKLAEGLSLDAIAEAFLSSDEAMTVFGANPTTADIIASAYQNILDRDADPSGQAFWSGLLDNEIITAAEFCSLFVGGVSSGSDHLAVRDQTDIGLYFAAIQGLNDLDDAATALAGYDWAERSDSLTEAKIQIDTFASDALTTENGELLVKVIGVIDDPFGIADLIYA